MTTSVIIPAYNAGATIAAALRALQSQDCSEPFEVIVVDDGSTDNTAVLVKDFPKVRYVHQENAGPAAARNHGARLAQGEYLCFTDSDCVPHPDWVRLLTDAFSAPEVAVVCGSYGIANPQYQLSVGIQSEIAFRHRHLVRDFPKVFGSYNFCIRKDAFDALGGFQEGYRQASGEDNDLAYKVIASGKRIYFERRAVVDHHHTARLSKYLVEQFRHGFWRAKTYLEHPAMVGGDGYTFWKDMAEVPWALGCILSLVLSAFHVLGFKAAVQFLIAPLLIFEVFSAVFMFRRIFGGIFYGFTMFLRSFARALGLSTGILYILSKKIEKKSK